MKENKKILKIRLQESGECMRRQIKTINEEVLRDRDKKVIKAGDVLRMDSNGFDSGERITIVAIQDTLVRYRRANGSLEDKDIGKFKMHLKAAYKDSKAPAKEMDNSKQTDFEDKTSGKW